MVHSALSGYIMFFTLYVTLAKSYYGLWGKKQLHEEKIHLTQQLERIGFSPDCDGEVMPTGRGVVNLQGNEKKRQLRSHQAEAKPQ